MCKYVRGNPLANNFRVGTTTSPVYTYSRQQSGKGPNGNQIQGDFRNSDDDHADEGDDGDDDCHHDKNGDGVHPWYQLDYHLYISIHPIL